MEYCKLHNQRAYTEKEFNSLDDKDICYYSGSYKGADDGKIRLYCFYLLHKGMKDVSVSKLCNI